METRPTKPRLGIVDALRNLTAARDAYRDAYNVTRRGMYDTVPGYVPASVREHDEHMAALGDAFRALQRARAAYKRAGGF